MSERRVRLGIHGHVQGVFYRQSAKEEAERLGLYGFVQNLPDGSVLAEAEGAPEAVHAFIGWCRKGPPGGRVEDVHVEELPPGQDATFAVRR